MATIAVNLPTPKRPPRNRPVAGRAAFPEIYFVKRIDNSCLKREVSPRWRRQCFYRLGLGIVIFFVFFLHAHEHFEFLRYGYQIEQVKQERDALKERNDRLRLEQARLADPQRIDALARRLGLVPAGPHQIVHLQTDSAAPQTPAVTETASNFSAPAGVLTRVP